MASARTHNETIVIAGSLAQKPGHGGHTWVFLQYLLGFKRLGWDVLFVDRLEPEMCVDRDGRPCALDESLNLTYFLDVMHGFGLRDCYALLYDRGARVIGLPRDELIDRTKQATFLLNVMGFLDDEAILGAAAMRVFLDIDPGFGQIWRELGLHDPFAGHDTFVTIGQNIGRPECAIPTCGLDWITTPQPIVLDCWPAQPIDGDGPITSVVSWRGDYGPLDYGGRTYGLRVHEFRKFVALPRRTGRTFELAIDIHPADARDAMLLDENGWNRVDPRRVAGDPEAYQGYVQRSAAEFMVAKNMYVQARSGWFSDRSICYLASGRPVLAQDTGLAGHLPIGPGLLTFGPLDEAAAGVEELSRDYPRHARAARAIAEECFDSDKVLGSLLARLGVA
jgi:hypothetical protein